MNIEEFKEWAERSGYIDLRGKKRNNLSIDRIDGSKGYEIENIRAITLSENTSKANRLRESYRKSNQSNQNTGH